MNTEEKKKHDVLKGALTAAKPQLRDILPRHMSSQRLIHIVAAAASRTPKLLACTPFSVLQCVADASQLGLDPVGPLGHAYLVPNMAAAAIAAGADGLIVEVHPDPEAALSDGYQSLDFEQFEKMMTLCRTVAEALGRQI